MSYDSAKQGNNVLIKKKMLILEIWFIINFVDDDTLKLSSLFLFYSIFIVSSFVVQYGCCCIFVFFCFLFSCVKKSTLYSCGSLSFFLSFFCLSLLQAYNSHALVLYFRGFSFSLFFPFSVYPSYCCVFNRSSRDLTKCFIF